MKILSLNQTLLQLASQTNHSVVNNRSTGDIQSIDNNSMTSKTHTNNPQPINDNFESTLDSSSTNNINAKTFLQATVFTKIHIDKINNLQNTNILKASICNTQSSLPVKKCLRALSKLKKLGKTLSGKKYSICVAFSLKGIDPVSFLITFFEGRE
jgi:hypothetical protein